MPAGLTVLDAAGAAFGRPLKIGRGGLREGVIFELAGSSIGRS
jgi:exopolyphosphatase/pppGpp-phosphohydrolase